MKTAALLGTTAPKISIRKVLHDNMGGWREARDPAILHASDLTRDKEFCPREFALMDATGKKPKDEYINTALAMAFDVGEAVHELVRNKWLGDSAVGHWTCAKCGMKQFFAKRPIGHACGAGGKCDWRYHEVKFTAHGVSGSIDAIVDVGLPKHRIVEIKTIKAEDFKTLLAPQPEHRWRTNLYLRLIDQSDSPYKDRIDTDTAHILYVSKGFGNKDLSLAEHGIKDTLTPFKEFTVKRNDDQTDKLIAQARHLHAYRQGGPMPGGICSTVMCKRAQGCNMVAECWSGKYQAGV